PNRAPARRLSASALGSYRRARLCRIRSRLWPYHGDIGHGEVIADAQHRMSSPLGQGVGEAVTEVQPGWMPPFAKPAPAAHRPDGQVFVYGHDVDLRVTEEAVNDVLPGRPQPGLDHDA